MREHEAISPLACVRLAVAKCYYSHAINITIIIIYNSVVVVVGIGGIVLCVVCCLACRLILAANAPHTRHNDTVRRSFREGVASIMRRSRRDVSSHLYIKHAHLHTFGWRWFRGVCATGKSSIGDISKFDFKRTDDTVHLPQRI